MTKSNVAGFVDYQSDATPLHGKCFRNTRVSAQPYLVVVLHGDAPFHKPDDQYTVARLIADENDDVVAVGLLRPGYVDSEGRRSPGKRGFATGDNYTRESIRAVAETVQNLRDIHNPRHVLIVGHSGGAAVAAALLGAVPDLVNGAVLVSGPFDVPGFRKHMRGRRNNLIWKALWTLPVRSLSPLDLVQTIDPAIRIVMLVGSSDDVAPPALTETYAERLKGRCLDAEVVVLEGRDHDVFLDEEVRAVIRRLIHKCRTA